MLGSIAHEAMAFGAAIAVGSGGASFADIGFSGDTFARALERRTAYNPHSFGATGSSSDAMFLPFHDFPENAWRPSRSLAPTAESHRVLLRKTGVGAIPVCQ